MSHFTFSLFDSRVAYVDSFPHFQVFPLIRFLARVSMLLMLGFSRCWIMDVEAVRTLVVGRHGNGWHTGDDVSNSLHSFCVQPLRKAASLSPCGPWESGARIDIRVGWLQLESRGRCGVRVFARLIKSRKRVAAVENSRGRRACDERGSWSEGERCESSLVLKTRCQIVCRESPKEKINLLKVLKAENLNLHGFWFGDASTFVPQDTSIALSAYELRPW